MEEAGDGLPRQRAGTGAVRKPRTSRYSRSALHDANHEQSLQRRLTEMKLQRAQWRQRSMQALTLAFQESDSAGVRLKLPPAPCTQSPALDVTAQYPGRAARSQEAATASFGMGD